MTFLPSDVLSWETLLLDQSENKRKFSGYFFIFFFFTNLCVCVQFFSSSVGFDSQKNYVIRNMIKKKTIQPRALKCDFFFKLNFVIANTHSQIYLYWDVGHLSHSFFTCSSYLNLVRFFFSLSPSLSIVIPPLRLDSKTVVECKKSKMAYKNNLRMVWTTW